MTCGHIMYELRLNSALSPPLIHLFSLGVLEVLFLHLLLF